MPGQHNYNYIKMKALLYLIATIAGSTLWSCTSEIDKFPPEPKNSLITLADAADENICVDENEGTRTIAFTTKMGWTASMVNDRADEWFSISPTSGAVGESVISIEFAKNTDVDERNASFIIKSGVARKTITVTQKPANSISMTSNRIEVPATGGLQAIVVRSKTACTATVDEKDKSWITIEPASKAVETEIRFTVDENPAYTVREGTIILSNGEVTEEFTVYQEGIEQEIVLSKSAYALPAGEGEIKVDVTSNVPVTVNMPDIQWITESETKSSSTNTYVFNVSANTTNEERTATISFSSEYGGITKVVTIRQSGLKDEGSIRILAIGNSFSDDAMEYLYQILQNAGFTSIKLGNLYIPSCTLETHAKHIESSTGAYTYRINTSGVWQNIDNFSSVEAIKSDEWDYISMQQASGSSGMADRYEPHLTTLVQKVSEYCQGAELMWHMTWAYQSNSTHSEFGNYNNDQMTMYNAILNAVKTKVQAKPEFKFVIPCGTAIQNLRTSLYGDNLTRDGYHLEYSAGRYTAALMWAKQITGCDIDAISWKPEGFIYTKAKIDAIKEAVNNAYMKPSEVTQSTITEDDEDVNSSLASILEAAGYNVNDYTQLTLNITQPGYYNSGDGNANILTNQAIYAATQIFSKTDIPAGSIIVQKAGFQYRPDAWIALDQKTTNRPAETQSQIVVVDEAWWGDFNYRGFNLSKNPKVALTEDDDMSYSFGIFVPKPGTEEIIVNAGYSPSDYTKLELNITENAHYNSDAGNSDLNFTMPNYDATQIFSRDDIPNSSLIVVKSGFQYRPDGWVKLNAGDDVTRPGNVTQNLVVVDDEWWGDFNYRGFNLAIAGTPALTDDQHAQIKSAFAIYVPKN